jgi:hypothetical protein
MSSLTNDAWTRPRALFVRDDIFQPISGLENVRKTLPEIYPIDNSLLGFRNDSVAMYDGECELRHEQGVFSWYLWPGPHRMSFYSTSVTAMQLLDLILLLLLLAHPLPKPSEDRWGRANRLHTPQTVGRRTSKNAGRHAHLDVYLLFGFVRRLKSILSLPRTRVVLVIVLFELIVPKARFDEDSE